MKYKILIADDHILFNEGVKQLLSNNYEIVAQVFNGKDVLGAIHLNKPNLILLDINLPSINGIDLAKEITHSFENIKIIFLSMYEEAQFIEQAKNLNVSGYMLKHSTKKELIDAIENVMSDSIYFDPKLDRKQNNLHNDDFFVKQFSLTPREIEIIKLIKVGIESAKIADQLFLSVETVKSHRKNIYFKLKINKVAELIAFAEKNGL